jgi:hypothetical protein
VFVELVEVEGLAQLRELGLGLVWLDKELLQHRVVEELPVHDQML